MNHSAIFVQRSNNSHGQRLLSKQNDRKNGNSADNSPGVMEKVWAIIDTLERPPIMRDRHAVFLVLYQGEGLLVLFLI